jgi:hypothetical protein
MKFNIELYVKSRPINVTGAPEQTESVEFLVDATSYNNAAEAAFTTLKKFNSFDELMMAQVRTEPQKGNGK